jgi:hypothetical protein
MRHEKDMKKSKEVEEEARGRKRTNWNRGSKCEVVLRRYASLSPSNNNSRPDSKVFPPKEGAVTVSRKYGLLRSDVPHE